MTKLTKYINRKKSIITGRSNLEHLYTLKYFPVFFGCVDTPKEDDLLADMIWEIDKETGVIQLTKLIPLDILYQSQHVDGIGETWKKYYNNFSEYISKQNIKSVLEIGGGQGQLAELVTSSSREIKWTIIEPNPTHKGNSQISIIKGFFGSQFECNKKFDAVIFSQVLEHAYEPKSFIKSISNFLKKGDKLIFAYPNLELWLKRKYTNAINFEHSIFLTDYFVDYLINNSGFKIIDKTTYEDHSFFYTVEKVDSKSKTYQFDNRYKEYKKIFIDFVNYHKELVTDLNNRIEKSKYPTYLFGGHIFSQYLIGFGLKTDKIINILDNSKLKQEKRFYGTNIIVKSPNVLKNKGIVNVILKAGIYNDEIRSDILKNINKDVIFW